MNTSHVIFLAKNFRLFIGSRQIPKRLFLFEQSFFMEKKESAKVLQMQTLSFAGPIILTKSQPYAEKKTPQTI